jgi:hypothetical protein
MKANQTGQQSQEPTDHSENQIIYTINGETMARPIFLIKVTENFPPEKAKNLGEQIEKSLKGEYHVIVAPCQVDKIEPTFIVLNVNKIPETKINALKKQFFKQLTHQSDEKI